MAKIVRLIVVIVLAFAAYDYGWPWLQGVLNSQGKLSASTSGGEDFEGGSGSGDSDNCLAGATEVVDAYGAGIGRFVGSGPAATGEWMQFAGRIQQKIGAAQNECSCVSDACALGLEALSELEAVVHETDGLMRGSAESFSNPATRLEAVYDLLADARRARG